MGKKIVRPKGLQATPKAPTIMTNMGPISVEEYLDIQSMRDHADKAIEQSRDLSPDAAALFISKAIDDYVRSRYQTPRASQHQKELGMITAHCMRDRVRRALGKSQ